LNASQRLINDEYLVLEKLVLCDKSEQQVMLDVKACGSLVLITEEEVHRFFKSFVIHF
jgi:hypothetical protein